MTKNATITTAIALTLAAYASTAYAGSVTVLKVPTAIPLASVVPKVTAPAIASVTPKVTVPAVAPVTPKLSVPTIASVVPKVTVPAVNPVIQKKSSATGFGSGTWQSVQATPVNPVTGLHASDLSRLTFSPNGTFTDYIVSEGGTGLGPNQTGVGGLIVITGKDKLLNNSSIQITETAEHICTGLGCMNEPTSLIGKSFTEAISALSSGVVNGGGVTWTKVPSTN